MLRFLLALSLILSLVSPHETGARGAVEMSGHGHGAGHHSGGAGPGSGDDNLTMPCCDALVGSCIAVVLVHDDMNWSIVVRPEAAPRLAPDRLPDGLRPSFDPPPPRA